MAEATLSVSFKMLGKDPHTLNLSKLDTIKTIKEKLEEPFSANQSQLRIIFKGRILKDEDTLESSGVETGNQMHVVKSGVSTPPTSTPNVGVSAVPNTTTNPQTTNPLGGMPNMNFGNMFGSGGQGGFPGMPDPQMLSQLMNNPMFNQTLQNVIDNPALLQSMMQNPMVSQMMQNNPVSQMMQQDPNFLRNMMQPFMNQQQQQQQTQPIQPQIQQQQFTPPTTQFPGGGSNPMQHMMQNMMNNPQLMNQLMGSFQGGAQLPTQNSSQSQPNVDYATLYSSQLTQLQDMGFIDHESNMQALQASAGNVERAVAHLIGNGMGN